LPIRLCIPLKHKCAYKTDTQMDLTHMWSDNVEWREVVPDRI